MRGRKESKHTRVEVFEVVVDEVEEVVPDLAAGLEHKVLGTQVQRNLVPAALAGLLHRSTEEVSCITKGDACSP